MHFGENQLSRSLIGLSPLPTTHPLSFQPKWVRASTKSYLCFTLAMGRSPRFGSRTCHTHPQVRIRFRYGSPHSWLTTQHATDSQAHSSKGTPPPHPKKRGGYDGLSAHGFRYSFTPLPGYFSPFPHGTYSTIGHAKYLGLPGGPGKFTTDSTSPPLLRKHNNHIHACFRVPDSHRLWQAIPHHFH